MSWHPKLDDSDRAPSWWQIVVFLAIFAIIINVIKYWSNA